MTTTVQAFLQEGGVPVTAFLYTLQFQNFITYNPYGSYGSFCFTDFESPLFLNYAQMSARTVASQIGCWGNGSFIASGLPFTCENIALDKLSYGIGFEDKPVEVIWTPDPSRAQAWIHYNSFLAEYVYDDMQEAAYPVNLTLKQALAMGAFTECPFFIHEALFTDFPGRGGTFLGTALMFRGFVRKTVTTASSIKISLASLMDCFQETQIPTQTLTPNNRTLPYIPLAISPWNDGGYFSHYSSLSGIAPTQLQVTTTFSIPAGALQDSWINFNGAAYDGFVPYRSGSPTMPSWKIQGNTAGPGVIQIYFYEPYILPESIGGFNLWAQQTTTGAPVQGFLWIPAPEFSA